MIKDDIKKIRFGNETTIHLLVFVAISVFMFTLACHNYSIWEDELFTLKLVSHSVSEMWQLIVDDLVHPPLYYYLLKLFLLPFGNDHLFLIQAAKVFSILWVMILMLLGSYLIEKQYNSYTALLFMLFLSGNMAVGYSVEIRMYSMTMCLAAITALYAKRVITEGKRSDWCCLILFTVLTAYTNYFGLLAVAVFWVWLFIELVGKRQIKHWVSGALICVLSYLPWIVTVLLNRKSVADYASEFTFSKIVRLFAFPFSCHNDTVSTVFAVFIVGLIVIALITGKGDTFSVICILTPVVLGIICLISTAVFHKFVIGRYLLPGWGVFWIGISVLTARLSYRNFIIPVIIVLDLLSLYYIGKNEMQDKDACNELIQTIQMESQPVYAEERVKELVTYLTDQVVFTDSPDQSTAGKCYAYFWSDTWLQLKDNGYQVIKEFPLSSNSIDILSKQ